MKRAAWILMLLLSGTASALGMTPVVLRPTVLFRFYIKGINRLLPAVVREGLVGIRHPVDIFTLLYSGTATLGCIQ